MDMKLVHNNSEWQNSQSQRAALPDTVYSCLAGNGMNVLEMFGNTPPPPVRKYPNPHLSFFNKTYFKKKCLNVPRTHLGYLETPYKVPEDNLDPPVAQQ